MILLYHIILWPPTFLALCRAVTTTRRKPAGRPSYDAADAGRRWSDDEISGHGPHHHDRSLATVSAATSDHDDDDAVVDTVEGNDDHTDSCRTSGSGSISPATCGKKNALLKDSFFFFRHYYVTLIVSTKT